MFCPFLSHCSTDCAGLMLERMASFLKRHGPTEVACDLSQNENHNMTFESGSRSLDDLWVTLCPQCLIGPQRSSLGLRGGEKAHGSSEKGSVTLLKDHGTHKIMANVVT